MKKAKFGIFFGFIIFVHSFVSHTLVVKLSDLHTMAQNSDIIIHGYVGAQKVVQDKLGRNITLTDIEIIDNIVNSKNGEIITIYQVGGNKNNIYEPIIGGQNYKVGQQVIFLGVKYKNKFVNIGAGQGKLDIINKNLITEDLGSVHVLSPNNFNNFQRPNRLEFDNLKLLKQELRQMVQER